MSGVFLYGGCVLRDAYELIKTEVGLTGYVARQSLISAMNPPVRRAGEINLDSAFQTRMASGDLASDLMQRVRRARDRNTRLFVFDFHIERVNVRRLPDGTFFTPTTELKKAGLLDTLKSRSESIALGSDRHTALWTTAARRFSDRLHQLGIRDQALVINAPWAEVDELGAPYPLFRGKPAKEVSEQISYLTSIIAQQNIRVVDLPSRLSVGDSRHKWARAPFHFRPDAMRWVADQMLNGLKEID